MRLARRLEIIEGKVPEPEPAPVEILIDGLPAKEKLAKAIERYADATEIGGHRLTAEQVKEQLDYLLATNKAAGK